MDDSAEFEPQGVGMNLLPHLLTATLDPDWHRAVRWSVQCPHEGAGRPCALFEECIEHPRPEPPDGVRGWASEDPETRQRYDVWVAEDDRWIDEHDSGPQHPVDQCWVDYMIREGESEPDYYLSRMAKGAINGPMRVQVGRIGYGEEAEPVFRLWNDDKDVDDT